MRQDVLRTKNTVTIKQILIKAVRFINITQVRGNNACTLDLSLIALIRAVLFIFELNNVL